MSVPPSQKLEVIPYSEWVKENQEPGDEEEPCEYCDGSGDQERECKQCDGSGVETVDCEHCEGAGGGANHEVLRAIYDDRVKQDQKKWDEWHKLPEVQSAKKAGSS